MREINQADWNASDSCGIGKGIKGDSRRRTHLMICLKGVAIHGKAPHDDHKENEGERINKRIHSGPQAL